MHQLGRQGWKYFAVICIYIWYRCGASYKKKNFCFHARCEPCVLYYQVPAEAPPPEIHILLRMPPHLANFIPYKDAQCVCVIVCAIKEGL